VGGIPPAEPSQFRSDIFKQTPPIETSSFERIAPRGREAAALRKMVRRFAAKWLAGQKSKTADLLRTRGFVPIVH